MKNRVSPYGLELLKLAPKRFKRGGVVVKLFLFMLFLYDTINLYCIFVLGVLPSRAKGKICVRHESKV